jgi:thiamine-monophosphate kinase
VVGQDMVPMHPALKKYFKEVCNQLVFAGGEDYELLFTASDQVIEHVRREVSIPITIIGRIEAGVAGRVDVVNGKGEKVATQGRGWDHFKSKF